MTNSKNTKRALLLSVLSMMLCVAMLIGSTFAWFTDSVTSGKNKIVAGNLDVELYAKDGDGYVPVTADTNLFLEDALWEPGHVEVVNLKVANLGTLALQYKFGINVAAEKSGTNAAGETFKLSDYIKFALIDGEQTYAVREDAVAVAEANAVALSDLAVNESGVLYPLEKATAENPDSRFVTLVVYMPTTVGNEANYRGDAIPTIDLGVNLIATQTPYESDSFDNQYDKDAPALSYNVTPENIQEYLNGEHGSMSNAKLVLASGDYGTLVIGTPSKVDTVYTCTHGHGHENTPVSFATAEEYIAHKANPNEYHNQSSYTCTVDNLTIVGQEGVSVAGVTVSSGHMHRGNGPRITDPILGKECDGYYLTHKLSNISFENIAFTGKVDMNTSSPDTVIDNVTFDHCSFTTNGTAVANGQGLRYYNESNNGNVKNLTVKDCSFTNCYQGVYTSHIVGISVTGCTFDTTGHNAIQLSGQSPVNHKAVVIENNIFNNIGDRIIRFNDVDADTQITIKNNMAVDSGDGDGQVMKATSLADGITYDISNNDWGDGKTIANPELTDR